MPASNPRFTELRPVVLDNNRVLINLHTANLHSGSNVMLNFDLPTSSHITPVEIPPPAELSPDNDDTPSDFPDSPYPNVEISLVDAEDYLVAQAMIIEHKEDVVSLTLHVRQAKPGQQYTVYADMLYKQETIDSIQTSFILKPDVKRAD